MSRYVCYLLVSTRQGHENKIYVGVTNNMHRRLRQHNGELKRGGAKYTSRYRPWRIAATVRHFNTETEALQFEWAWQHPARTRHLKIHREAKLVNGCRSFCNYLRCVAFLVQTQHWQSRRLKVHLHHLPDHLRSRLDSAVQNSECVVEQKLDINSVNT